MVGSGHGCFGGGAERGMPIATEYLLPHDALVYDVLKIGGNAKPMKAKMFHKLKSVLLPQLRERADPPPRLMCAGTASHETWHANLRQLLDRTGGKAVRGFKLFKLPVDLAHWREPAWRATAHVVVATVSPSGTTVYTDPNAQVDNEGKYVFVPSARVHRELTNDQLLSGDWITGSVVGGHPHFCAALVAYKKTRGRARSVVATSPEALISRPRVVVRMAPHFVEWHRVRALIGDAEAHAELMGAAVFTLDTVLDGAEAAEVDAIRSYSAITESAEACVDGVCGLKLELQCREQLLSGKLGVEEARVLFFAYFDRALTEVRSVQAQRTAAWREKWGASS